VTPGGTFLRHRAFVGVDAVEMREIVSIVGLATLPASNCDKTAWSIPVRFANSPSLSRC
jgi:hypothetical protein